MSTSGPRSNAHLPRLARRGKDWTVERLDAVFGPITRRMAVGMLATGSWHWMRYVPAKPKWLGRWATPPRWSKHEAAPAPELLSQPGTRREPAAEDLAFAERPLHDFNKTHIEAVMWTISHSWTWLIAPYPALRRAIDALAVAKAKTPASTKSEIEPAELSRMIRAEGQRLGMSEVGFAKADPRYTFAEYDDPGDTNIIVCILEQDWAATNTAPSSRAERAAFRGYGQLNAKVAPLVEYIKSLGYEARPNDWGSQEGICIQYAEQAGLGQLGINGQLLTPQAGSRCRLALITTAAPVALGQPVDYGIPGICDQCQVCVQRCPVGAIPKARKEKRGVVKASIKPERCFPIVAQAHGCAVCMKVCPIQRYGLGAVQDHLAKTGEILGKGSDELEGYIWPLDGRYLGPGEKPKMTAELLNPPGWHLDITRVGPLGLTPVDSQDGRPAEPAMRS